jgi:hypothetical protein
MSKKTIVFKMPATDSPRRDDEPSDFPAPIDEPSAAAPEKAPRATEMPKAVEPDQWVRRRDLNAAPAALSPPTPKPGANASFAIDLAAERDLQDVVALSLMAPAMLGWFWLANAMDRYRRIFAG